MNNDLMMDQADRGKGIKLNFYLELEKLFPEIK